MNKVFEFYSYLRNVKKKATKEEEGRHFCKFHAFLNGFANFTLICNV